MMAVIVSLALTFASGTWFAQTPDAAAGLQTGANVALTALLFEVPEPAKPFKLWLRIENRSREPQVFCRKGWGYSLRSADPNGPADATVATSIHGCGGDSDPFWMLLPDESRFDPYEIKGAAEPDALLEVSVELVEGGFSADAQGPKRTIRWRGRIADALAAGKKLSQFQQPK
jgi:hypothetical protein